MIASLYHSESDATVRAIALLSGAGTIRSFSSVMWLGLVAKVHQLGSTRNSNPEKGPKSGLSEKLQRIRFFADSIAAVSRRKSRLDCLRDLDETADKPRGTQRHVP